MMVMSTAKKEKVSIVIPVFNEEESLIELTEGIVAHIPEELDYEIIFINDGSTDSTESTIKAIASENIYVHLISFRRNFGKAAALEAGFRNSSGEFIITMDGDLQDDPIEIPRFIEKLKEGYDLVSGWKQNRKDPLEKRLPSKVFNKVVSRMAGIQLHDINCGFKAYRRSVVESIDLYGELHRYIPCLAMQKGFRIAEIPVHHSERRYGKSKYGVERYLRGLFDALTIFFLIRFEEQPMYLFGRLGLLSGAVGVIICLYLTVLWFSGNTIGHRPLLHLGILLIVSGIQLFSLGLIGELIVRINHKRNYDEGKIKEKI